MVKKLELTEEPKEATEGDVENDDEEEALEVKKRKHGASVTISSMDGLVSISGGDRAPLSEVTQLALAVHGELRPKGFRREVR